MEKRLEPENTVEKKGGNVVTSPFSEDKAYGWTLKTKLCREM